jgi:16S rRNA (cytosine967-C5)-methyltransferase
LTTFDPRRAAFDILCQVEDGAFSDLALDRFLASQPQADSRDRGLLTELVYGALRRRGRIDFALSRFCRQPLRKLEPGILCLLRLGAHQLLHLDKVPARAAVYETVELARKVRLQRACGLLNGVLRALDREKTRIPWPAASNPQAHLEHTLSIPGWLAKRWLAELGAEEAVALAAAFLDPAPATLRVNTLKVSRDEYLSELRRQGGEGCPGHYVPEALQVLARGKSGLPGNREGWYQVQDQASQLMAHLLDPRPGEHILDACAAPGGKTTHIAALTANGAHITALDLHPQRVTLIRDGAVRLGCRGIKAEPCDLSRPPAKWPPESFDRILVDAPCSGLGVLRRNPETRWRRKAADIREMAQLQKTILRHVAPLVRSGGTLVYSVCTFTPEETEAVISDFLARHPEFARQDPRDSLPEHWHDLFDSQGALRTFPHRHDGMDAFWAVRMKKG